jgi:hypothetical protein
VGHPIPPRAPAAGASSGADHWGKGHVQIATPSDSNEGTNGDAYLNTAMFSTQPEMNCEEQNKIF